MIKNFFEKINIPKFLQSVGYRIIYIYNRFFPFSNYNPIYIRQNFLFRAICFGLFDFFYHMAYWLICTIIYRFTMGKFILPKVSLLTKVLLSERIIKHSESDIKEIAKYTSSFWNKFDAYQAKKKHGDNPIISVNKVGYISNRTRENHTVFYEEFNTEDLNSIVKFVESLDFSTNITEFMKSNFQIYNVRVWRSLPHKKLTDTDGTHRDNLPPWALKIMFFRGYVDENSGAFTYESPTSGQTLHLTGNDQIVLIDASYLVHRAGTKIDVERFRDCMEISLMPSPDRNIRINEAGFEAEHPYNPFFIGKRIPNRQVNISYFFKFTGKIIAK